MNDENEKNSARVIAPDVAPDHGALPRSPQPGGSLRLAWEAGFRLCRSYGDHHAHFEGAQKELQWLAFVEALGVVPTDEAAAGLLNAAKATMEYWDCTGFSECEDGCECIVEEMRAAIAKAEGR